MKELKQFTDNLEKLLIGFKDDSVLHQKLSSALSKKTYKSKLNYGLEYGCEELISKVYSVWVLEREVLFIIDVLSQILIGLTSEKLQAEAAVIISKKVCSTVRNCMWWGMGQEDDFAIVHSWCDVLKEIDSLPISAPCDFARVESLNTTLKKKAELIRLWEILFKSRHLGSKFSKVVSKPEALDVFRDFSTDYPEITNVYGFSKLLKAIESSSGRAKKAQKNDPIRKQISIAANVVSGRAKTIICRTRLDNRKKAEACITASYKNLKNCTFRKRTKVEILQHNLSEWHKNEEDFESILKSLFKALIDETVNISNNQELISAIKRIYQAQNNTNGAPPWYPDFRENPYFPNPDIEKCGHFLFVLGSLEQGNLSGRWEKESLQYLLKNQTQEGYWSSSTFRLRPDNYATVVAMHALGLWKPTGWKEAVAKAAEWLWKRQKSDGSWTFNVNAALNKILLNAIDLADGKFKHSLKLSKNVIEFVEAEEACEPEIKQTSDIDVINYGFAYSSCVDDVFIQNSFVFRPGQVLFGGKDLGIKTGIVQEILKKLVDNINYVVKFKELEPGNLNDCEAGEVLRGAISYLKKKFKKFPVKIENRRGSGYLMISHD